MGWVVETGAPLPGSIWGLREMQLFAQEVASTILLRVFSDGRGSDDEPLDDKPYSASYARRKERRTGSRKVTLVQTGAMARELRVKEASEHHAVVGLSGPSAVYGPTTHKQRPWFTLSPRDLRFLRRVAYQLLVDAVRRAGL